MLAVQYIIGQLNSPVEQLIQFIYSWQDVSISLDRMNEIHTETNEENAKRIRNAYIDETLEGHSLKIKDLSFKYDIYSPKDILSDINLFIPNGKVTAIVGASGSGKTTFVKLLLGFYEPLKGSVQVGSANLNEYNLGWWRSQCGAVMQEGYLFSDTIARNIAISDDEPDIERIRHAARVANIANYIEALPLAYNTMIGQDGQSISQGQRQRILIARVVYKNPMFVFLDEATNALDGSGYTRRTDSQTWKILCLSEESIRIGKLIWKNRKINRNGVLNSAARKSAASWGRYPLHLSDTVLPSLELSCFVC